MAEINENFKIKFSQAISPDISFKLLTEKTMEISGKVTIDLDLMLGDFVSGLGLKVLFSQLVKKTIRENFYLIDIKGIAEAVIELENEALKVRADYRPAKEWWAKPVALIVLAKLLNDFSGKIEDSGLQPGFRQEVKDCLQQLRKKNQAQLKLKKLFENQTFYTPYYRILIHNLFFGNLSTKTISEQLIIEFNGMANIDLV